MGPSAAGPSAAGPSATGSATIPSSSMPSACPQRAWDHLPILIAFAEHDHAIDAQNGLLLDEVAALLRSEPWFLLRVEGHRDHCRPEPDPDLDERRADAVLVALADRGIPRARVFAVGYDDTQPRATHDFLGAPCTAMARPKKTTGRNARVEFSRLVCAQAGAPVSEEDIPVPMPDRPFPEG